MEIGNLKQNWVLNGLLWGSFMFLTITIVLPLVEGVQLVAARVFVNLVIWLVMGLAYGYTVYQVQKKKEIKSQK